MYLPTRSDFFQAEDGIRDRRGVDTVRGVARWQPLGWWRRGSGGTYPNRKTPRRGGSSVPISDPVARTIGYPPLRSARAAMDRISLWSFEGQPTRDRKNPDSHSGGSGQTVRVVWARSGIEYR